MASERLWNADSHTDLYFDTLLPRISVPRGEWDSSDFLDRSPGNMCECSTRFGENVQILVQCQGAKEAKTRRCEWRVTVILTFAKAGSSEQGKCVSSLCFQDGQVLYFVLKIFTMGHDLINCRVLRKWSGARQTWFESQLLHFLAMWPCTKSLIPLSLLFSICKMTRKRILPQAIQEEGSSADTSILARWDSFLTSDLQNCKRIHFIQVV